MNWRQQLLVIGIAGSTITVFAQQRIEISATERIEIAKIVLDAPEFKAIPTSNEHPHRVLTEMYATSATIDGAQHRMVTVFHFEYEKGLTIRSVVDLDAKKVVSVKTFEAYSTPLAPEERLEAIRLSAQQVPEVRAFLDDYPSASPTAMPFAVPDAKSPKYGHRVATLLFRAPVTSVNRVIQTEVDLTESTAKLRSTSKNGDKYQTECSQVVEQHFPVSAASAQQRTAWRVAFGIQRFGSGNLLYIKGAEFQPAPDVAWFKVLEECRPFEMFVPYHRGTPRYYDLTEIGGDLQTLSSNDLGPQCLGAGRLLCENRIAVELHDGQNLWFDHYLPTDQHSRRAEQMEIWSVRSAGNYVYPILYVFRSDGSMSFRIGATAHNHDDSDEEPSQHFHLACWRLNVAIGDAAKTEIQVVRHLSSAAQGAISATKTIPYNGGMEGFLDWIPEEFTQLRFESKLLKNQHTPAHSVTYDLLPARIGAARTYAPHEEWSHHDFWVTLRTKQDDTDWNSVKELPECLSAPRSISGKAATVFVLSGLIHRPRDEDFGPQGTNATEGVALTAWSGIDLIPRNVNASTPLRP